ncbi:hypothetical protein [Prevotella herbatica]|nr:hypothetical protein [Prevotella herbatica]
MVSMNKDVKTRIFCRYITKYGHRIYPKHGKLISFVVNKKNIK